MRVGIVIPSGLAGEFQGWEPDAAWARALELARSAERLGFDHVWVADHLHGVLGAAEVPTFEAFTLLTAIASETSRVRLAPGVACASFRNPALLVKMATTLDVASSGRVDLPIGAGWFEPEWRSYGYGFPPAADRLATLRRTLDVVTATLGPGLDTGAPERLEEPTDDPTPICVPTGLQQPRIPLVVGGNGQEVTWRLAARYADELNLDGPQPEELPDLQRIIDDRCTEIGRDPSTLRRSAQIWWDGATGGDRVELLQHLAEQRLDRIVSLIDGAAVSDEPLEAYADDCRAAGLPLVTATG